MLRCVVLLPPLLTLALLNGTDGRQASDRAMLEPGSTSTLQQKVAAAIARDVQSGLTAEQAASQMQLLNPALSLPANSELHVASARSTIQGGSWLLRMECSSRHDCLPFHVLLHAPNAGLLDGQRQGQPARPGPKPTPLRSPVARSGDHVTLVEERSGMRLRVTAVCLESGGLGDRIRVRNLATRRVLLATVVDKDLVRVE